MLWEDLNSTLKHFIHLMHKKKSMPVPIIISNWQCWKLLFCPCIVIVIYRACSPRVPAIIYIQWLCLPGGKNHLYELERCHSCKLLLQSYEKNGNYLLWIFMFECYGYKCSWELWGNYIGVAVLLIDKQCNESLKLCVKLDSGWRCHCLPYYMFHVIFFFTWKYRVCSCPFLLSVSSVLNARYQWMQFSVLKGFFCCNDKWSRWDIHDLKGTSKCSQQQTNTTAIVFVVTLK